MDNQLIRSLPSKILAFLIVAFLSALVVIGVRGALASSEATVTQTLGWVEKTTITGVNRALKAKLDTGATTTSINAEVLEKPDEEVESGGTVKFYFVDTDGNKTLFERPLVRWVKIKGGSKRPVVQMQFCLAGKTIEGEVSLAERDEFNYAVLIGRNVLKKGQFAVDSRDSFVASRACDERG